MRTTCAVKAYPRIFCGFALPSPPHERQLQLRTPGVAPANSPTRACLDPLNPLAIHQLRALDVAFEDRTGQGQMARGLGRSASECSQAGQDLEQLLKLLNL